MKKLPYILLIYSITVTFTQATAILLDFEGLQNLESVDEFYNGGAGGMGSAGTDHGISFSNTSLAIIDFDSGGTGNFGGEPSSPTVLFFNSGTALMNVAAGFDTGFSFYYSAVIEPGFIRVFDGLNASGNLLATLNLPATTTNGGDPTGDFSPFFPIGVTFSGIARSVDFGGTADLIAFDNITIGSERAIPEPSSSLLIACSVVGMVKRRNRRE